MASKKIISKLATSTPHPIWDGDGYTVGLLCEDSLTLSSFVSGALIRFRPAFFERYK